MVDGRVEEFAQALVAARRALVLAAEWEPGLSRLHEIEAWAVESGVWPEACARSRAIERGET